MSQPGEAKELLTKNPQLGYALFQSMLMMNLVDSSVIQVSSHRPFIFQLPH